MRFCTVALSVLCFFATSLRASEVKDEWWAKGTSSAAEAFAKFAPKRIGMLLVATDQKPDPGFRYAGRALLPMKPELAGESHRMAAWYELRLYEAIRGAFQSRGYEVQSLNRKPWKGLRLKEIMAQAQGVDAVCAVHYSVKSTRDIWDRKNFTWWSPFEGMHLRVQCVVFDRSSQKVIYGLELEALGTEALYENLGKLVYEEPLHPGGRDEYGNLSPYKIAIYQTSIHDPKTGNFVPVIRTSTGSLDIAYVKNEVKQEIIFDKPGGVDYSGQTTRLVHVKSKSILGRLLKHVPYEITPTDTEYFDIMSIDRAGKMAQERIPERRP